jgi:hypothetical protein
MRESRPYGSVRGARDETCVPTATRLWPEVATKARAEHACSAHEVQTVYLFCYCQRIVNLDSLVADGNLDFCMPQKKQKAKGHVG